MCAKFQQKILNSMLVGARQSSQFFSQITGSFSEIKELCLNLIIGFSITLLVLSNCKIIGRKTQLYINHASHLNNIINNNPIKICFPPAVKNRNVLEECHAITVIIATFVIIALDISTFDIQSTSDSWCSAVTRVGFRRCCL